MFPNLTFLKLGGSLITEKDKPRTPRIKIIQQVADEIYQALQENPEMKLIIGHGSGSFGHNTARQYRTRDGVFSQEDWRGFAHVWYDARALNQLVIEALFSVGLPVISFPPSAIAFRKDQKVRFDTTLIQFALQKGLIPVVQGDVIFDLNQGGTILSTEEVFSEIAPDFAPKRVLLAGVEEGVWADYPTCQKLIEEISQDTLKLERIQIGGSSAVDVTGGMLEKVKSMLSLSQKIPGLEAWIFSGVRKGNILRALQGKSIGTKILYQSS
ncbi:isopentenyl phosphate kinase [Anaerolinea thermophila]|uniref:isopentenyl phosphate kinase n=2 Tax=Anaerolinea TaxID=233189 RepID=UPI0026ED8EF5|nr:isopentenyl phosphate kinase [Anaerolinea thermophila]